MRNDHNRQAKGLWRIFGPFDKTAVAVSGKVERS